MRTIVVRGTGSFVTLLLHERGVVVPSDDITRCDLVLRRPGVADVLISSAERASWFELQYLYDYGGRQINVVRIDLSALVDPPPDGHCEALAFLWDAEHPSGQLFGVIDIELVPGHIEPSGAVPPTITSLVPDTVNEGFGPETITVNGTNFVLGSVVQFVGSPRETEFISATELEVELDAADTDTVGTFNLRVSNRGVLSNTSPLEVEPLGTLLQLTNRVISRAGQAMFALAMDAEGMAASGGNSVSETFFNDEYIIGWQLGGPPGVNGSQYEFRWSLLSGTLDAEPTDSGFTPLPQNTWSFSEWASALPVFASSFDWFGGFFTGPPWIKNTIGSAVIRIEIRRIDLTDGPVTADITITRSS